MKKTVSRLLALALTAALVLTGCGGGTTTEEPADTSDNTGTTESTETTEGKLLKATNLVKMKSLTWLFQRH